MKNNNKLKINELKNINSLNFMRNFNSKKRIVSPKAIRESKADNYYYSSENENKKSLYNNANINQSQLNQQYRNYTNPINYIQQQGQNYQGSLNVPNNYYLPQQNFYNEEEVIMNNPNNDNYIYAENIKYNYNNNYSPIVIPQNENMNNQMMMNVNMTQRQMEQMQNPNDYNDYNNYNNERRVKYNKNERFKSGVNLNISNCETQYPMTYMNSNSLNKRKPFIHNYNNINNYIMNANENDSINTNETNNFHPKNFKKNKNIKNNNSKKKQTSNLSEDPSSMPEKGKNRNKSNYRLKNNDFSDNLLNKNMNNDESNNNINMNSKKFHKKIKSQVEFKSKGNNFPKYEEFSQNEDGRNININNYYNNIYGNTKGRMNQVYYGDEGNTYREENNRYYNIPEYNKNNIIGKNIVEEYDSQEKFITKIRTLIKCLENYYIDLFRDYFNYFIGKLKNYDQYKIDENKNSLLQRFQRIRNNRYHNYSTSDYFSPSNSIHNANANNEQNEYKPMKNIKKFEKNNTSNNIFNNLYVPKKNVEYVGFGRDSYTGNNNNNTINISDIKGRNPEYYQYFNPNQNNMGYPENRLNLSIDYSSNYFSMNKLRNIYNDNSLERINYYNDNNPYNANINKSQNSIKEYNRKTNNSYENRNANIKPYNNFNDINNLNRKPLIYVKPKPKINLKRIVISKENKKNNNNVKASRTLNNFHTNMNNISLQNNSNYIYNNSLNSNNKSNIKNNININKYNTSFAIKNIDGLRSPVKSRNHARNISDVPKDVIDNANINMRKKGNFKFGSKGLNNLSRYNDTSNNVEVSEFIGKDDLIEETIIKDICTYDKKLWVYIKYISSAMAKQNFIKMKVKRRLSIKHSGNEFINQELNSLKPSHTDSIELISPLSILNSHFKYSDYSNKRKINIREMKEISEEKESFNNSYAQDNETHKNNLINMINILEGYNKKYHIYFEQYFFEIFQNKEKNNDEQNNTNQKFKDNCKRNLFPENPKENNENEEENYFSDNTNSAKKKDSNINFSSLRCNSTRFKENRKIILNEMDKKNDVEKEQLNNYEDNNDSESKKENNNNKNDHLKEKVDNSGILRLEEKIIHLFRLDLLKYSLKNKKLNKAKQEKESQNEKEKIEKKEKEKINEKIKEEEKEKEKEKINEKEKEKINEKEEEEEEEDEDEEEEEEDDEEEDEKKDK